MSTEIKSLLEEVVALNRLLKEIDVQDLNLELITINGVYNIRISDLIRNSDSYKILLDISENELTRHISDLQSLHLRILNYKLSLDDVLLTLQDIITHWYLSRIAFNYCKATITKMKWFIMEMLQAIASLYGHEYIKNLGFIQLVTLGTPLVLLPFSVKIGLASNVEVDKVAIIFHSFHLCRTVDTYLLIIHELGHIFKKYYIEEWKLWFPVVNEVLEFVENKISSRRMLNEIRSYYKSWLAELFADFFSLSFSSKYFNAFKNRYGYRVQISDYERDYPPLTIRLKFMLKSLEKLYEQTDDTYEKYVDEIIRQYSGNALAGFLDARTLEELLDVITNKFTNIVKDNAGRCLPYIFIANNRDSFKYLGKILLTEY